jgi:hypothetical protein
MFSSTSNNIATTMASLVVVLALGFLSQVADAGQTKTSFSRSKTNTRLQRQVQAREMKVCHAFLRESDVDQNGHLSADEYMNFIARIVKGTDKEGSPSPAPGRLEQMMAFNQVSHKSSAAKASKVASPLKEGRVSSLLGCHVDRHGDVQCHGDEHESIPLAHIWIGNDADKRKLQQAQVKTEIRKLRASRSEDEEDTEHLSYICGELLSMLNKYELHSEV